MWLKRKNFHQSPKWRALARRHKQLERRKGNWKCVDCDETGELESDHVLSVKWFYAFRLKLWNLVLRCRECNGKKGSKLYWDLITIGLLIRVSLGYAIRRLIVALLVAILLFLPHASLVLPAQFPFQGLVSRCPVVALLRSIQGRPD